MLITIPSTTLAGYQGSGSTATLKILSDQDFRTSDGVNVARNYVRNGVFYQTVNCTVASNVVTVPSYTIDSTTDSSVPNGTYTAILYDSRGKRVQAFYSGWRMPHTFGSTPTWVQISTYNGITPTPFNFGYPDTEQVQTLIDAALAGFSGGGGYRLSSYASLGAAISSIGSTKAVLDIDSNVSHSATSTIPSTLKLRHAGGLITKSGSGTITFAGMGIEDPESREAMFSGFNAGDITWSGTEYPTRISTLLWDNASWTDKQKCADQGFIGKEVTIVAYPGTNTAQFKLHTGHSWHLTRGNYYDTYNNPNVPRFYLESNTTVYGDGIGQTIFNPSTTLSNERIFYGAGMDTSIYPGFDGKADNITIRDMTIQADLATPHTDTGAATINFGNGANFVATRIHLKNTLSYGIYCGAFPNSGYYADGCFITDNIFEGVRGQNTGLIQGRNIVISRNLFKGIQPVSTDGFIAAIDIEPNVDADLCENILISDNLFDGTGATQFWNAIVVQAGGNNGGCVGVKISGNIIRAGEAYLSNAIIVAGAQKFDVSDNYIYRAGQSAVLVSNVSNGFVTNNRSFKSGTGGVATYQVSAAANIAFDNNIITGENSNDYKFLETEASGATVNTSSTGNTVTRTGGAPLFYPHWVGLTVTINGADYTVATVTDNAHMTLTTDPGNQTGVALSTKFSSNTYSQNTGRYTLLGTSKVVSAKDREVRPSLSVSIFSNQNDYTPGAPYYRINVTPDAARSITGLTFDPYPYSYDKLDGEEHLVYNAGTFALTLKHQDAGSSAANRFKCSTAADIVLSAGQAARLIYSSADSRWLVFKLS